MRRPEGVVWSGLGDEAGSSVDSQIRAHTALGWQEIELRTIDGVALPDLPAMRLKEVRRQIADNGMRVSVVASRIGNWDRPVTAPLAQDLAELVQVAEGMHELGCRMVRIMSYPNDGLSEADWQERVLERIAVLAETAARIGVVLVHENCSGWAGRSAAATLRMLDYVRSPALQLLFDTGNGVAYGYDSLDFLKRVLPRVVHVHIKDGVRTSAGTAAFTFPGQGAARVGECLRLLVSSGYRGIFAIEPHLHLIPHLRVAGDEQSRLDSYIEYGRQCESLVNALAEEATPRA